MTLTERHHHRAVVNWPQIDFPGWWRHMAERPPFELEFDHAGWLRVEEFIDGDTLVVRAEIPDVDPEKDVRVSVADGIVSIDARREQKEEHRDKKGYRSELRYGSFSRQVAVPPTVKPEDVTASYKDGILDVRIPTPSQPDAPESTGVPITRG